MFEILGIIVATLLVAALLVQTFYPWVWRDLYVICVTFRVIANVRKACKSGLFIIDIFEQQAQKRRDQPFLLFKDDRFTYGQMDEQANRMARVLMKLDIGPGDTVALVMSNEPAFIWIYLGAQKLGAKVALVNHHLMTDGLHHSIISCAPKLVIVGDGLEDNLPQRVNSIEAQLDCLVYYYNNNNKASSSQPSIRDLMSQVAADPVDPLLRSKVKLSDPCAFIFTSGTTGLPKPAIISHKKALLCSYCYGAAGFTSKDTMYLTLPLYHSSALNLALMNVVTVGGTLVLREKFSASHFWSDCVKYKVTSFQYIGEMLRYLVNSPEKPEETQHKVWAAIGNGLREDIWLKFQSRFKIAQIYEFYGSTEIPTGVNNMFNVPGSVGRLSPLLSKVMKLILVRVDRDTYAPYRNSEGRCEIVKPGECGVLIVQLSANVTFEGYLGRAADTNERILKDVLEPGDFYVTTNDVFVLDDQYNLYFKDRLGDTFRWKGENVCTAEVSNVLNSADFVMDTNVFGVEVPRCEGKAGMAAVKLRENEEVDDKKVQELGSLITKKLPAYARPRFLRFQRQVSLTSTFKQQKTELVKEGFDPTVVKEPLYYLDRKTDEFRPLDSNIFHEIEEGGIDL